MITTFPSMGPDVANVAIRLEAGARTTAATSTPSPSCYVRPTRLAPCTIAPPGKENITLRRVMAHQSGLYNLLCERRGTQRPTVEIAKAQRAPRRGTGATVP